MGKKEDSLIEYYNQRQRFAELMNGFLFEGKPYLRAEDVTDADRRQEHRTRGRKNRMRHRYRDIYKEVRNLTIHLILGTEFQERVDYAMPLRVMDMELLGYLKQKKDISAEHFRNKEEKPTKDEYLSEFYREDRLIPEITLVLYLGEKPWDGAKSLHELLDFAGVPEEVRKYVGNYGIHILDVRNTTDGELQKFPRDIRFMLLFMKYAKDKEALGNMINVEEYKNIGEDTMDTLAEYLNEPGLMRWREESEKEGDVNMCEGFRELLADSKAEGKAEGENTKLITLIQKKIQKGKSLTETAEDLEETEASIRDMYEVVRKHPAEDVEKLLELLKTQAVDAC